MIAMVAHALGVMFGLSMGASRDLTLLPVDGFGICFCRPPPCWGFIRFGEVLVRHELVRSVREDDIWGVLGC